MPDTRTASTDLPAELPPLAAAADIEKILGRPLTDVEKARVDAILASASALVRAYTGLDFTAGTDTIIANAYTLKVRLPQSPVTSVDKVQPINDDGTISPAAIVGWTFDGASTVYIPGDWASLVVNAPEDWQDGRIDTVAVTYGYGYDPIPADAVAVVAGVAARALTSTAVGSGVPGVVSESLGDYSYRITDQYAATAGTVTLLDADKLILARYTRPRVGSVPLR